MNGRVQDPTIGRFLSADPYVPNPLSGQSFNRYSYVANNPLRFIDPSGFDEQGPDGSPDDSPPGGPSYPFPPPICLPCLPGMGFTLSYSGPNFGAEYGVDPRDLRKLSAGTEGGNQISPAQMQTAGQGERRAYPRAAALRRATAEAAFKWLRVRGLADFEFSYVDIYARDLDLVTGWRPYNCGEDPRCGGTVMMGAHTEGRTVTMFRAGVEPELWPLEWTRSNETIIDRRRSHWGDTFIPEFKSDFEFAIFIMGHESWHVANPGKGGQGPEHTVAEWTANDQGWMYLLRYRQQLRRGR